MELKYYLRGLGLGIAVTAIIMGIAASKSKAMTNEEIIARAKQLGMTEDTVLTEINSGKEDGQDGQGIQDDQKLQDGQSVQGAQNGQNVQDAQNGQDVQAAQDVQTSGVAKTSGEADKDAGWAAASDTETDKADNALPGNTDTDVNKAASGTNSKSGSEPQDASAKAGSQAGNGTPASGTDSKTDSGKAASGSDSKTAAGTPASGTASKPAVGTTDSGTDAEAGDSNEKPPLPSEPMVITIGKGDGSYSASKKLADVGAVSSASEFDTFLCENGYDKKIRAGTYTIPADASEEQMARIITGVE